MGPATFSSRPSASRSQRDAAVEHLLRDRVAGVLRLLEPPQRERGQERLGLAADPERVAALVGLEALELAEAGADEALQARARRGPGSFSDSRQLLDGDQRDQARRGLLQAAVRVLDQIAQPLLQAGDAVGIGRDLQRRGAGQDAGRQRERRCVAVSLVEPAATSWVSTGAGTCTGSFSSRPSLLVAQRRLHAQAELAGARRRAAGR